MASVYEKAGKWYMRYKDHSGRWRDKVTQARTKTEARRMADDLERKTERQRLGLEERPPEDGGGSLGELLRWWLDNYSVSSPSHRRNVSAVEYHLLSSSLAPLPLTSIAASRVEAFLHEKDRELAPQTVNHLRAFMSRAFNEARKVGRYTGPNPIETVTKRKIPRRMGDFLRPEEVRGVLGALDPRWRPLFATAIYTGLRKGELLALRKTDVDLRARLLTVCRSWDRDTTKGGHADVIPIATELVPFLEEALRHSPSELVFPRENGSMMRQDVDLEKVLRRAMGRAGIVTGWRQVCRRKGCGHAEVTPDDGPRKCPACSMRLWPKPQVRPLRFHDLRHTTATLLLQAGVPLTVVQRILRHTDPRTTISRYGHLTPDFLRAEVDNLSFGVTPGGSRPDNGEAAAAGMAREPEAGSHAVSVLRNPNPNPFAASLLQAPEEANEGAGIQKGIPQGFRPLGEARQAGLEPTTPGLEGRCSIQLSYWRPVSTATAVLRYRGERI